MIDELRAETGKDYGVYRHSFTTWKFKQMEDAQRAFALTALMSLEGLLTNSR